MKLAANMKTWSINFKGKIPNLDKSGEPITSSWFKKRDDTLFQLKTTAAYLGFDVVHELAFEQETHSEAGDGDSPQSTHYFTAWRAIGTPGRLKRIE